MKQPLNTPNNRLQNLLNAAALCALCVMGSNVVSAQIVSPLVAQRGVTPAGCCLTNLSCGANAGSPVDPSLPTYVITHGYNPLPNRYRLTNPQSYALKIRHRHGRNVNVLAYHWDSRGQGSPDANNAVAIRAGITLSNELLSRGVDPRNTTLIGHSMGSVVITTAANRMFHRSGQCAKKLILIDGPKRRLSLILREFEASYCDTKIENIWAGGLSGLGAPVCHPQVKNIKAPARRHRHGRNWLNPARNNHIDILLWYYECCL